MYIGVPYTPWLILVHMVACLHWIVKKMTVHIMATIGIDNFVVYLANILRNCDLLTKLIPISIPLVSEKDVKKMFVLFPIP